MQPGAVFIHAELCERFDEQGGYPKIMLAYPLVMDGYDAEQRLVVQWTTEGWKSGGGSGGDVSRGSGAVCASAGY